MTATPIGKAIDEAHRHQLAQGLQMESVMAMNIEVGQKALVTLDNWFYAPDGQQYRAVFGTVRAVRTAEESLGVKPNGRSTNWYLEIGNMTIAGCQVHYALRTNTCNLSEALEWLSSPEHGLVQFNRPSVIYHADPSDVLAAQ